MNVKALVQVATCGALFAIAVAGFAYSVGLVGADNSGWPSTLLFAAAGLASALLLANAYINPGYRVQGCTKTHIQVSLGCLTSSEFLRTEVTSSSINEHYKQTYALGAPTVLTRPHAGSIDESRTCHRCGTEISLTVNSANAARREALTLVAWTSVLIFGGWAIYLSIYFATPIGYERQGLLLPGALGIPVSLAASGFYFRFWASSMLDRAALWTSGDHRWFALDGKTALGSPE